MSAPAVTIQQQQPQPQPLQPHTPLSPAGSPVPQLGSPAPSVQQDSQVGPVRRKTSRRANTAERRATHNAVERQRRETLNSRFLDLAALLPNLASVRRPSKSAIVNSSIVIIHAQRRARAVAGRELRALKAETDALRRELNEWRDRAAMPRVDEGARTAEFGALLALEGPDEMGDDERAAYEARNGDPEDDEEDEQHAPASAAAYHAHAALAHAQQQMAQHHQQQHQQQQHQQQQQPQRVAVHTAFDPQAPLYDAPLSAISMHSAPPEYGAQFFASPPGSAHGQPFLAQRFAPQQPQLFPMSAPAPEDDAASVGSAHSHHSGGGSPLAHPQFDYVPHHLAAGMGARELAQHHAAPQFGWPVQPFKPYAGVIM